MTKCALVFALREEVKPILKSTTILEEKKDKACVLFRANLQDREWFFCKTGMGMANAHESFELLINTYAPEFVLSIGYSGATNASLKTGDVILAHEIVSETPSDHFYSDVEISEKIKKLMPSIKVGRLMTLWKGASPQKKKELGEQGVDFVDMETAALMGIAKKKKIRFVSVRVIFDELNDEVPLPDPIPGSPEAAPATLLLKHPRSILKIPMLMKKNSICQKKLEEFFNIAFCYL